MAFQMRDKEREEVTCRARLDPGKGRPLVKCTVVDISQSGAKLTFDDVNSVPNTFDLLLSRYGQQRFSCQIVWRSSNSVGVQFIVE